MTKIRTTKLMRYPVLITIIGAIAMLLTLLLPYASATKEQRDRLEKYADAMYVEEIGMTNADAMNISLFEYGKIYAEAAKQEIYKEISIASLVIICIFAGVAAFTLLMALFKKSIGIIFFDLLAMGVFKIVCFDFESRRVIPSSSYDWGLAAYLVYVIGAVVFAGAIWLFIEKRNAKKLAKAERSMVTQEQKNDIV